jgi:gamma-glutamyl hercynylcysteine S-oxide synthase
MLTAERAERAVAGSRYAVPREMIDRVVDARGRSDALFDIVRSDSLYERPIPERHRIIFYVGHLEAFDWNLLHQTLGVGTSRATSSHAELDRLFAFGIDPVGGGLPSDVPSDWPSLEVVRNYISDVRNALEAGFATVDFAGARMDDSLGTPLSTLLQVAIEHRLMHVETLAYMLHRLPLDRKIRGESRRDSSLLPHPHPTVIPEMISIPEGVVALGLPRDGKNFGWDNEYEAHTEQVPAFQIDRYKVTNRQYLEFMTDGGYQKKALWSEDDWNWKNAQGISHPAFWEKPGDAWSWRGMFELIPFNSESAPLDWPVYVSHAEASAYALWAGKSLPLEAQWQRASQGGGSGNADFLRWDPTPVGSFPGSRSAFGADEMEGNGWEWTSTVFAPFGGFEPFPFYRGYSADFFDGKHFVMKGGSPRTAACMLRPSFRNWFQAHYQYAYVGFRCVSRS